jgi:hypothetical protein
MPTGTAPFAHPCLTSLVSISINQESLTAALPRGNVRRDSAFDQTKRRET